MTIRQAARLARVLTRREREATERLRRRDPHREERRRARFSDERPPARAQLSSPPVHRSGRMAALWVCLIMAVGVCAYWNSRTIPFLWDDYPAILTNQSIRHLWPLTGPLSPPLETPMAGRPVANVSLAINYAIGGFDVTGYHMVNIAIHVACALVLFGVVRRTLAGRRLSSRFLPTADSTAALTVLVWMLHPLHTEAVDYVTQRTELMMAFFFLATSYCAIRARHAPGIPIRWESASVVACALGMASKATMVVAPLTVLLYDRVFEFSSMREAVKTRGRLYAGLAATWVLLGALLWLSPRSTVGEAEGVDWQMYLLNQADIVVQYLRLSVWPETLILDYGLPRRLAFWDVMPQAMLLLTLLVLTIVTLIRWPPVGFLGAVFFITLAPTSSIVPIITEVGAERRTYLPLSALAALATCGGRLLLNWLLAKLPQIARLANGTAAAVTITVLVALATRTVMRNAAYRDPLSLWRSVVDTRPHGRARVQLASSLIDAGRQAEAVPQLRLAVQDFSNARFPLGVELAALGHVDEAIGELGTFIDASPLHPNRIPARALLGRLLASKERFDEAAAQFRAILELSESSVDARVSLGDTLMAQGHFDQAIDQYRAASERVRNHDVEIKFGRALMEAGLPGDAARRFQRALEIDPRSAVANRYAAEAFWAGDDSEQALRFGREAARLNPKDSAVRNFLGIVLASGGRIEEALAEFRLAVELDPSDPAARANLARVLEGTRSTGTAAGRSVRP